MNHTDISYTFIHSSEIHASAANSFIPKRRATWMDARGKSSGRMKAADGIEHRTGTTRRTREHEGKAGRARPSVATRATTGHDTADPPPQPRLAVGSGERIPSPDRLPQAADLGRSKSSRKGSFRNELHMPRSAPCGPTSSSSSLFLLEQSPTPL